jgi:hypothetical protein
MHERLYANLGVAAALLTVLVAITLSERAAAQVDCPSGTVAITTATRAAATAAGLPTSVACWIPSDPNAGEAAGQAKEYLQQHATSNANISCFNSQFAEDLEKLMQAVPGGPPTITDGYRSPQAQSNLSSQATQVGACGSYHQYGMAADFNNANSQTLLWLRENAPQYGLTPIPSLNLQTGCSRVSSFCDPGHIQIQGPLPPRNQCGICSSNVAGTLAPTGAAQSAAPDDLQYLPQSGTQIPAGYCMVSSQPIIYMPCGTTLPQSQFAPAPIAQPLPAPTPVTSAPSVTPTATPTTSACTPQYYCSNSKVYYQSSSCSTSVFQTCQYGCLGTTCALATTTSSSPAPTDILRQLISLNAATTTASSSLNTSIYTIVQGVLSSQSTTSSQTSQFTQNPAYTSDTFSSGSQSSGDISSQGYTPLQQLLSTLESLLTGFLSYLRLPTL